MDQEIMDVEEGQDKAGIYEEFSDDVQNDSRSLLWDMEDQLYEEWRDKKDLPEEANQ